MIDITWRVSLLELLLPPYGELTKLFVKLIFYVPKVYALGISFYILYGDSLRLVDPCLNAGNYVGWFSYYSLKDAIS